MSDIDKYKNNVLALQAWQEGYDAGLEQCEITGRTVWLTVMFVIALFLLLVTIGCSDAYRYPCQDPANRTSKECKPPDCYADETCTEYLIDIPNETKS